MENNAIVSLAILKVNFDEKKDYLETFLPFVLETIRCGNDEIISIDYVQEEIKNIFGLNIPIYSIDALLRKACKKGYVKKDNGKYVRNKQVLRETNFKSVRNNMLKKQEELNERIVEFMKKKYNISLKVLEAEKYFLSYIEKNQILSIKQSIIYNKQEESDKSFQYYIGKFIQKVVEEESYLLEYIEDIIKGLMISTTVFVKSVSNIKQNFMDTKVYMDTPLIMSILGLSGKDRGSTSKELLDLLSENNIHVRCFEHSIEEVKGILYAYETNILDKGYSGIYGPAVEYFIEKEFHASDIHLLSENIEDTLNKMNIKVEETPPYNNKCYIDESELKEYLIENIKYKKDKESAVEKDVASISAILRLRKGLKSDKIERCRALFVTSNNDLVKSINKYMKADDFFSGIMPIIGDYSLTNLLWLKNPNVDNELPKKKVIADSFAATQPDEAVWQKYIQEVDKLRELEKIDEETSNYYKYAPGMKDIMMEVTQGNEDVICRGSIKEIIEKTNKKIADEAKKNLEKANKELKLNLEAKNIEVEKNRVFIQNYAQKQAEKLGKRLRSVFISLGIASIFLTLPIYNIEALSTKYKALIVFILLIIGVMNLFGVYRGESINSICKKLEEKKYYKIIKEMENNTEDEMKEVAISD